MAPVGQVEQPEVRELRVRAVGDALVEAAPAELRLAVRRAGSEARVRLHDVDDLERGPVGGRELLRPHEGEVVRGGVVLGEEPVRCPRERSHRQVEAGRAVLPLVAAGRLPVADDAVRLAPEDVRGGAVDRRVPAPAPLVPQRARVADARDHEPVLYPVERVEVPREPAERPQRPGAPEQAVRVLRAAGGPASAQAPTARRPRRGCRSRAPDGRHRC